MSLTFLTIDEVASMLKLSRDTVYRLASHGKLPGRKVGRAWRFAAEEIEDYVAHEFANRQHSSRARTEFEEQKEELEETIRVRTVELTEANHRLEQEVAERQQTEAYLRAVFESVGDGLIVADDCFRLVLFNRAAEEILGTGITNAEAQQWPDIYGFHLADGRTMCPAIELPLVRAISGERVDHAELVIRNELLPHTTWVAARATPVLDDFGHLRGGVMVFHDITARKQGEQELHRSEQRLRNLLDCLPQLASAKIATAGVSEDVASATSTGNPLAGILEAMAPPSPVN